MPILTAVVLTSAIAGFAGLLTDLNRVSADDAGAASAEVSTESAASAPSNEAVALLRQSRNELFARKSVRAKLQETVSMGDRKFRASGSYTAGQFPKLRLEFDVEVGKTTGTLKEICDGSLLWTEQAIKSADDEAPTVQVSRTVIDDVLSAVAESGDNPEALLIAGLGVGGVPALLAGLERAMVFEALKSDQAGGREYSVIQGRWNDVYLTRFGGAGGRPLPNFVPDRVRIYIDQETLFPTRVLYLKQIADEQGAETSRKYRSMLSLEFSEIVLDGPVSEEDFRYLPPTDVETRDRTKEFLDLIEQANRSAETAGETP
ncbi:MAG: hypothetical protein KDA93_21260 [Planctomycetaceae bacterium]|nr:hypothetical protein [Planctomycetaceae bacterium]